MESALWVMATVGFLVGVGYILDHIPPLMGKLKTAIISVQEVAQVVSKKQEPKAPELEVKQLPKLRSAPMLEPEPQTVPADDEDSTGTDDA